MQETKASLLENKFILCHKSGSDNLDLPLFGGWPGQDLGVSLAPKNPHSNVANCATLEWGTLGFLIASLLSCTFSSLEGAPFKLSLSGDFDLKCSFVTDIHTLVHLVFPHALVAEALSANPPEPFPHVQLLPPTTEVRKLRSLHNLRLRVGTGPAILRALRVWIRHHAGTCASARERARAQYACASVEVLEARGGAPARPASRGTILARALLRLQCLE